MCRLKQFFPITMTFLFACTCVAQQRETLLIGPGDTLQVKVFDTPELDEAVRVTDAGTITLVLGGDVQVSSLTQKDAARSVEKALVDGRVLLHPQVLVTIAEYVTQKVSVMGEVKAPGAYAINTTRSVLDVLTLAGGLTDLADRQIMVERHGTHQKLPYFVSNEPDAALDSAVAVNPGDKVIVPKAGIVYVLGDVARPGGYTMTNNDAQITVLELVARAGGTNHSAVPSHAKLIHKSGNTYIEEPLPLSAMQKGNHFDLPLRADDIVYVPYSYLRNFGMQASGVAGSIGSAAVYKF